MRYAILLLLAVACSGGSSEPSFVPSPDLNQSHPFLAGDWGGLARSNAGGPAMGMGMQLLAAPLARPSTGSVGGVAINTLFGGSAGGYQADGDRVRVSILAPVGVNEVCDLDLRVSPDHQTMTGTYRITLGSGAPRDAGTVELSLPTLPVTIEVYETPEVLLVIRRK